MSKGCSCKFAQWSHGWTTHEERPFIPKVHNSTSQKHAVLPSALTAKRMRPQCACLHWNCMPNLAPTFCSLQNFSPEQLKENHLPSKMSLQLQQQQPRALELSYTGLCSSTARHNNHADKVTSDTNILRKKGYNEKRCLTTPVSTLHQHALAAQDTMYNPSEPRHASVTSGKDKWQQKLAS